MRKVGGGMSKNRVKWHPYPQEEPNEDGFYLVTISDYVNYVVICKYSMKDKWASISGIASIDIIAWTELPIPFDREQHNVDVRWHPYPDDKPDEVRMYLTTEIFEKEKTVSMSLWLSPTNSFFHRDDEQVLAWAMVPEPYEEDNNG